MSGIATLWSIPGAWAVAQALVSFLWQGALVALVLAGVLAVVRSPRLRYGMAAGALLLMIALPVATVVRQVGGESRAESPIPGADSPGYAPSPPPGALEKAQEWDPVMSSAGGRLTDWLPAVFAGWLLGVVLLSVWNGMGWMRVRQMARREVRAVEEVWLVRLGELKARMGIGRAVALLESARVQVPTVIGWLKPVILVPASVFSGLSPRQLEAVLAHELAHVRRHDDLINLLQTLVETLLFYHPAVWWVSRQVRIERESCCDDLALAVCGDRLGYARALAALEELRAPRLALAANGGELLARIRRLAGVPAPSSGRSSAWLAGALALAFLLSAAAVHSARRETPAAPAPPPPAPLAPVPPTPPAPPAHSVSSIKATSGTWTARREADGRVHLQMEVHEVTAHSRHEESHSDDFRAQDLIGLGAGPDVSFEMRRAAGTFHFQGRFNGSGPGSEGGGTFTFQGDPGYVREMAGLGYRVQEDNLLSLAMMDVAPAFAREIRGAGYTSLSLEDLVRFRIHGVSAAYVRDLAAAGYRRLSADDVVRFRNHGVSPELARSLAALGFRNLSPDDIIRLQIHGATPEYIRALAAAGYQGLTAEDLVRLRIHGVSPEWINQLAVLGYRNVPADDLVRMRIHGVNADFIRAQQKGDKTLTVDELIRRKIHGGR
jgi:Zn-dependent protease with chaperone function